MPQRFVEVRVRVVRRNTSERRDVVGPVTAFAGAVRTCVANIANRFQQHVDARLSEELTTVEQRRRLLKQQSLSSSMRLR